ncbi:MAG: PAS domain-containing protein [Gemmatimonadetes bacterium]|nr:PAS domain-containing protein [Gemmatimonadota bacterium]
MLWRVNRALAEINGIPVEGHVGRTLREVLPVLAPALEPIFQRVAQTGESVRDIPITGETPLHPGIVRHWTASFMPIIVDDERGVAVFVVERTAQVAAERALRESELRFRTICEAAPLGIFLTDGDGNVLYANPAAEQILGVPNDAVLGQGWARAVHPDDMAQVAAIVAEANRTHAPGFEIHTRLVRPATAR